MVDLNDLIFVCDDSLDSKTCDLLISTFESNPNLHERIDNDKKPNFTQVNLTTNSKMNDEVESVHNLLISKTIKHRDEYYEFVDKRVFPKKHSFEQFRIKKYNNDGNDLFDTHVDVQDYSSARRFLTFMWYLNDVETGGRTVFHNLQIEPKAGRLIIFPPLWMFPHRGESPISNEKYILHTYLHYQ
jgi:hypothetical protein